MIGRWKMIDNLRRTLSAPAAFLALVAGWTLAARRRRDLDRVRSRDDRVARDAAVLHRDRAAAARHFQAQPCARRRRGLRRGASQIALLVTLLAHQAWLMTDAIVRTLYRLFVSHRRMLEWVTAAQAKLTTHLDLRGFYGGMAGGVALGAAAAVSDCVRGTRSRLDGGSIRDPVDAFAGDRAMGESSACRWPDPSRSPLADARALRLIARRTWRFFETFVTAEDNMLPPDNFQEDPKPVLAHRTSPTNLGLYLLSAIAAHDFGWIGTHETVERLEATLATMNRLERFRGHFYNWYDTRDLRPLEPKYVSSVDSGNLAGHLIALGNACREMSRRAR